MDGKMTDCFITRQVKKYGSQMTVGIPNSSGLKEGDWVVITKRETEEVKLDNDNTGLEEQPFNESLVTVEDKKEEVKEESIVEAVI